MRQVYVNGWQGCGMWKRGFEGEGGMKSEGGKGRGRGKVTGRGEGKRGRRRGGVEREEERP